MSDWEERIDRSTNSSLIVEHAARYSFALPIIRQAQLWVDLGSGTGVAAREAVGTGFSGRLLLVDKEEEALGAAREELQAADARSLRVDLAHEPDLARLRDEVLSALAADEACITCFEVIEHLSNFAPLLDLLVSLASDSAVTVVLSVPNDAFWSLHNPHHQTIWGGDAFEEFRSTLPEGHVVAFQHPVAGTYIEPQTGDDPGTDCEVRLPIERDRTPSHYLATFGPGARLLTGTASVTPVDLDERRAWERQREADLAFLKQREADLVSYEREAKRLQEELDTLRAEQGSS